MVTSRKLGCCVGPSLWRGGLPEPQWRQRNKQPLPPPRGCTLSCRCRFPNPYASPLYGDLRGLPPTLILVGTDDVLRDDGLRMAARLRDAGCHVEIEVWPHMWHVR